MSRHFHRLTIKELIRETADAVSIVFAVPSELKETFTYQSGQYLTLKASIGGQEVRRSYSLSSHPQLDEDLKVTSKVVPGGKMSTYLFQSLKVGDQLEVMPPDGTFTLSDEASENFVFFAAGSGITPIISLMKEVLHRSPSANATLYYGNKDVASIIFREELERMQAQYGDRMVVEHWLSRETDQGCKQGRIDADNCRLIIAAQSSIASSEIFICGPEGMIETVKQSLLSHEIQASKIHIEYFASPADQEVELAAASGSTLNIEAIIDGETHAIEMMEGESILDAAERCGIDPPYSCQSGVCTTCKGKVLQGEVNMGDNFGLDDDEVAEGYILTCISTPATPGVKVSWDED